MRLSGTTPLRSSSPLRSAQLSIPPAPTAAPQAATTPAAGVRITPEGNIGGSFQDIRRQTGMAPVLDPYQDWLQQFTQANAERASRGLPPLPYPPAMLVQAPSGPTPVAGQQPGHFTQPLSQRGFAARGLGLDLLEAIAWAVCTTGAAWALNGGFRKLFTRPQPPIVLG